MDRQPDPVLERRDRIRRLVSAGQRLGYGLFAAALILFFIGFASGFPSWIVNAIVATLVVGSIVLAPAIVFGYGVKAADRDDREQGWGRGSGETVARNPIEQDRKR